MADPTTVTLVGPTASHWSSSRGRLRRKETDVSGDVMHPYYGCVIAARLQRLRSVWTQERSDPLRRQKRMEQQAKRLSLGLGAEPKFGHYISIVLSAPWAPKLVDFAWRLVVGVLPTGMAIGCKQAPEYAGAAGAADVAVPRRQSTKR